MSHQISEDCSSGLHEYCTPCECECHGETMKEEYVLFCALCKIYDNYVTPLRSSVFCWKCEYTMKTFLAGMTVTQFNGSKRYITYEIPMEHWPKFNIATLKEAPGTANADERVDILMNL